MTLCVEDEAKRYLKGPFYYYGLDVECSLKVHHLGVAILRDVVKLSSWPMPSWGQSSCDYLHEALMRLAIIISA